MTAAHIFLDLETTGLDSERDVVTEAAWICGIYGSDETFLERHYAIEYDGFPSLWSARNTSALLYGSRRSSPREVWRDLFDDCLRLSDGDARPVYLVGACPAFDDRFLRKIFREVPYNYHVIDVEAMAMGALGWVTPRPLRDLRAALGIEGENEKPHNALEDAREAKLIFESLVIGP